MSEIEIQGSPLSTTHQPKIVDFAVIKVFSEEGKYKHFIAKVCDKPNKDGDYEVNFLSQSQKIRYGFQYSRRGMDPATVRLDDIVHILPKSYSVAATTRFCEVFKFEADLILYCL